VYPLSTPRLFWLKVACMDFLAKIAEQKIREAMERGDFDNLSYHGKPLKLDDLTGVPAHLRMGYKILKNAGILPEEMQLKKEIVSLQDLLDACYDATERSTIEKQMNEKVLRYNMMMEKRSHRPTDQRYRAKILRKLRA
jgi:Domain of unknown function (DUF1992)